MTDRIKRLREALRVEKFPICVEKAQIIKESFVRNDGWPQIIRRAQATADYLDRRTIFIEPDELIIGNIASKPMGMELGSLGPGWPDEDLKDLLDGGQITISEEDYRTLRSLDDYFLDKGRTQDERQGSYYGDDRLWPFIQCGFLCPPWQQKNQGRGQGAAGVGWGLGMGPTSLNCPDYEKVIFTGYRFMIEEAEARLRELRFYDADSVRKADFYKACLIGFPAMIRLANRYADLAEEMAEEEPSGQRKAELLEMAKICRRVPEYPAQTFREGVQAFFFYWILIGSGTTPGGRFDQYLYPLYQADIEAGRITREEALELLECLRLKIMQMNFVGGGKGQREKWAGMARWHNFVIGGCDEEGNDATNELTYLLLEAAKEVQTPHNTLTVRVSEKTPDELMVKAMEVVRTGIGMPAFISEDCYIEFLTGEGIPLKEARKFAIAGCMDIMLPGASRNQAFGMMLVPMILELALFDGINPRTQTRQGPSTGLLSDFKTYEEFYQAFLKQVEHIVGQVVEEHNILIMAQRDLYPDIFHSAFLQDGMEVAHDGLDRKMPFENGAAVNVVGMANTMDSLAAIKKLVFDEKTVDGARLLDALGADWEGYEEVRKACLDAPKYGNNLDDVDQIGAKLWHDIGQIVRTFRSAFDAPVLPTAISITAHAPGGALTGATPDGRRRGETFADASISPVQGKDVNGPLAVLQSAMKLPQNEFMATLMNMKFHPSALKTESDLRKLGSMVKAYLTHGGKQIQFNVTSKETLLAAKKDKEKYRDLIVRVAGYSAYYVTLTERVQDELILRTEQML
ncbi:hypothetical protein MUB23_11895 [Cuneatibacter sp. NSJ-177]|uniref:pyruvate formate lyase family protein n=1 Tax=Cuneatibacter sp. NSJ-177 TaxID=2931401 RepID=UPI001FD50404|nr:pyruvate formate lyase family protein [Cuneatibacter sp. NSJ-177]MCJ7836085.1 hypothetical protein [Cuneatibacter sp. NSJ-177]